jgi:hypothetical protein
VISSRVHQKLERGRVETLLERYAEPLAASVPGSEDDLRRAWRLLLLNGAHDSACGCSHDQVAADVDARFAETRTIAEDVIERARAVLAERPDAVPSVQPEARKGAHTLRLSAIPGGVEVDGVPIRFLDEPDVGDLYNFCWAEEGQQPSSPDDVQIDGDRLEIGWDGLRVIGSVARPADDCVVAIDGVIQNEREDHRLRLHVGLPKPAGRALAGAPFELVDRPPIGEGGEGEVPSPTWPARHVVIASGTAVLHEGVFEYEIAGGHEIAVTLLRCVGSISRPSLATRPWPAGPSTPTPGAQMLGETGFRLGVWPGADRETLLETWERFAAPLAPFPRRAR